MLIVSVVINVMNGYIKAVLNYLIQRRFDADLIWCRAKMKLLAQI